MDFACHLSQQEACLGWDDFSPWNSPRAGHSTTWVSADHPCPLSSLLIVKSYFGCNKSNSSTSAFHGSCMALISSVLQWQRAVSKERLQSGGSQLGQAHWLVLSCAAQHLMFFKFSIYRLEDVTQNLDLGLLLKSWKILETLGVYAHRLRLSSSDGAHSV